MKKSSKVSLISGVAFFILGIIIFLNPDLLVKVISYGIGGLLILLGIYKSVNYYIQDKRFGVVNRHEIAFGITAIILGVLFIFLAGTIEFLIRLAVGGWLIIAGLNKLFNTFYTTNRDSKFYALIVIGVVLIGIGLYIVLESNLVLSIIGLFMMIYGVIDFISYFVYKTNVVNENNKNENNLEIEDATYEEKDENVVDVEFEEKKDNKKKKDK